MKRQRGRNRNKNNRNNNHNNHNRSMDSQGPDVKVRGNAATIYEKYTTLARDAKMSGSRVKAENYLQHAEHYLRLMNEQEAAKAAAREKAEAERAARGEKNDDEDGDENRRNNRHRNRRDRDENKKDDKREDTGAETPSELDVVTPVVDVKPRKTAKPKAKKAEADDAVAETADKPKRRRKAPARKDDTEVEAAE
jgi:hypothetical protein